MASKQYITETTAQTIIVISMLLAKKLLYAKYVYTPNGKTIEEITTHLLLLWYRTNLEIGNIEKNNNNKINLDFVHDIYDKQRNKTEFKWT